MVTSQTGIDLIKRYEALKLEAYSDPIGIPTIGYGHTSGVYLGQVISENQAEHFLALDLKESEDSVNTYLKYVTLNQNQFDALVSLVFNVGKHNIFTKVYGNGYAHGSRLYNLIKESKFEAGANEFTKFVNAGGQFFQGLLNRREEEQTLFLKKKGLSTLWIGFIVLFILNLKFKWLNLKRVL